MSSDFVYNKIVFFINTNAHEGDLIILKKFQTCLKSGLSGWNIIPGLNVTGSQKICGGSIFETLMFDIVKGTK
jgi:hypothetical protein